MTSFASKESRFLDKVWRSGTTGKVALFLYILLGISPLFAELIGLYAVRGLIFSLPTGVTDKIAVLAFLVGSWFFLSSWFVLFLRGMKEELVRR